MLAPLLFGFLLASASPQTSRKASDLYQRAIDRAVDQASGGKVERADDAAFLRRISLDLTGVIPTADDVEAFLADKKPTKRIEKVDELIASPAAARRFGAVWSAHLLGPGKERFIDRAAFASWLEQAWSKEQGWDQMVRMLITASGSPDVEAPVNFILSYQTPEELTGGVARLFMGASIQCAECHDHPEQDISRRDFFGMVAFFSRTQRLQDMHGQVIVDRNVGETRIPDTRRSSARAF